VKIERITISRHRIDLDPPFFPAWDGRAREHFDATIIRVETDEGLVGIGSGDTMLGFAGHEELFIGRDPLDLDRHHAVLSNLNFHYGRCWPLDLALWDLAGKAAGKPVWKLLGGHSDRVRAYASSATLRDAGAMAEIAQQFREQGFKAMKIRFHHADWRDDLAAVETVRRTLGDGLTLMVDCNQGWRMPWDTEEPWQFSKAMEVAVALQDLGVFWMEEPLHRGNYAGMTALRDATSIRIAGAEMAREIHELDALMDQGCLDVLQPDVTLAGGITGLVPIARRALDEGLIFTPHTWSDGMGVIANTHLAAGLANPPYLEFPFDPPQWTLARRDFMLTTPFDMTDGWMVLTDTPGLGFELDEDRLAATRL
jgi:L-alanine-DL-glutamate epimerase-like enolase superfamily enzyme